MGDEAEVVDRLVLEKFASFERAGGRLIVVALIQEINRRLQKSMASRCKSPELNLFQFGNALGLKMANYFGLFVKRSRFSASQPA
jgi:hypothetical protein